MPDAPSKLQRDAARNIVTKYLRVRAGENVIIETWNHTLPQAAAMLDEVRRAGGRGLVIFSDEDAWWRAIDRKQSQLLGEASAPEWAALRAADVYVNFWGPGDTDRMERLPDSADPAFDWMGPWYATARKAGLRGLRMTGAFVTAGRAREWGLDFAEWQERTLRASLVDPEELAKSSARLTQALSHGKRVRITHPNGTDVEVALAGAAPRLLDGRPRPHRKGDSPTGMLQQVPAGKVDVALDSRTAEGSFRANRRTNIWWNWHSGGTVEFGHGRVTSYSFEEGAAEFTRRYKTGTAGKDRASALYFGLNPAVHDVPNLESVERGCVCLVIGRNDGLPGGTNHSSFLGWFSLAGAEISIDGTPFIRAGKLI
jgi:leucyl aminopeptidase (aminopeptidase T)